MISRRQFLRAAALAPIAVVAAPWIVRASSLMPVRKIVSDPDFNTWYFTTPIAPEEFDYHWFSGNRVNLALRSGWQFMTVGSGASLCRLPRHLAQTFSEHQLENAAVLVNMQTESRGLFVMPDSNDSVMTELRKRNPLLRHC